MLKRLKDDFEVKSKAIEKFKKNDPERLKELGKKFYKIILL